MHKIEKLLNLINLKCLCIMYMHMQRNIKQRQITTLSLSNKLSISLFYIFKFFFFHVYEAQLLHKDYYTCVLPILQEKASMEKNKDNL